MVDYVFYNVGCTMRRGVGGLLVLLRRLLRRLLRPIFQRLVELLQGLSEEQKALRGQVQALSAQVAELDEHVTQLDDIVQTTITFGWDYVSLGRQFKILEQEVRELAHGGPGGRVSQGALRLVDPAGEKADPTADVA